MLHMRSIHADMLIMGLAAFGGKNGWEQTGMCGRQVGMCMRGVVNHTMASSETEHMLMKVPSIVCGLEY